MSEIRSISDKIKELQRTEHICKAINARLTAITAGAAFVLTNDMPEYSLNPTYQGITPEVKESLDQLTESYSICLNEILMLMQEKVSKFDILEEVKETLLSSFAYRHGLYSGTEKDKDKSYCVACEVEIDPTTQKENSMLCIDCQKLMKHELLDEASSRISK
jgi:hypothetical protein